MLFDRRESTFSATHATRCKHQGLLGSRTYSTALEFLFAQSAEGEKAFNTGFREGSGLNNPSGNCSEHTYTLCIADQTSGF